MILVIILLVLGLIGYFCYKSFFSKEAKEQAAKLRKKIDENRNRQINYYSSQPLIIKVSERISADIIGSIGSANRDAHIPDIKVTYAYSVFSDCITESNYVDEYSKGHTLVNFEYERIENLYSTEMELVVIAILRLVNKNIRAKYPKDPGGLNYSVTYSKDTHKVRVGAGTYNKRTYTYEYDHDYGYRFRIIYSCQNGRYKTKTKL